MRRTIRVPVSAVVLIVVLGAIGCAPVMSHGPRVQEGTQIGVTAAALASVNEESRTALVPYLTEGRRREDGSAEQFTAQIVVPTQGWADESVLAGIQMDYYREQASSDSAVAHGWGIQGTPFQVMPYVQWGVFAGEGGVYTTQGVGSMGAYFGLMPEILFWSPGFGMEYRSEPITVRVQMSTLLMYSVRNFERVDGLPLTVGVTIAAGDAREAAPAVD